VDPVPDPLLLRKSSSAGDRNRDLCILHLTLYPTLTSQNLWSNIPLNILTSDILVPVYGTYENLVVSSVGLKPFNLLGPSSSSRAGMSSLG